MSENLGTHVEGKGHTPGPWSLPHFAEPEVNCQCQYILADGMMGAVASVYASGVGDDWQKHGDNPKFAEAVANAHLIAAAPDLLDALKSILRHGELANIDKGGPHWGGGKKPPTMDAWAFPRHMLTGLEAAVAKAEGRS